MRTLEESKSIDDGGSFDRLVKKMEEAANGDESLKLDLLTQSVLGDFLNLHFQKAMDRKLLAVKEKESNWGVGFVNHNYKIPRKSRSKALVSHIESNTKSMKRCYFGVIEEEVVKEPAVKKQRKAVDSLEKKKKTIIKNHIKLEEKKKTVRKNHNLDDQLGLNPPPDLPQEFKDHIEKLKGTNVKLVAQKELTGTDMNPHQSRFSVPSGQVRNHDFLSEEEIHILSQKGLDGIPCSLIQPCLEEIKNLKFKRWDMTTTFIYTLIRKWKSIAYNTKNQLEVGSKVQLWSFRIGSELWFAMIKLK